MIIDQEEYERKLKVFNAQKDVMALKLSKIEFEKSLFEALNRVEKLKTSMYDVDNRIKEAEEKLLNLE